MKFDASKSAASSTSSSTPISAHWTEQRERGSAWALRLLIRLSLTLGRRVTRPILWFIAVYFVITAHDARRASRDYLNRVFEQPVSLWKIFQHVLCFAITIHDRFFLLNNQTHLLNIEVFGEAEMHAINDSRGGLLLFGTHMGSFGALRATADTLPNRLIAMAMYEENAANISRILASINPQNSHAVISLGRLDSMLQIQDHLQRGQMVGMLADRHFGKRDMRLLPILGAPAPLPTAAFRMAALLRVPTYFMVSLYRGGNHYEVHFEPLVDFDAYAPEDKQIAIDEALKKYADSLTRFCRKAPYNWFNFFDFWNASGADAVHTSDAGHSKQTKRS